MTQYNCDICGATFSTPSEYRRHMQTSHPEQAPSAADLQRALSGVEYPASPKGLAKHARDRGEEDIAEILQELAERDYRDAAEVSRAFGEKRSHEEKPTDQPSVRGGEAATDTDALSAARAASFFAGMEFPASADELADHARSQASEEEMKVISRLPDRRYRDMSEVAKAFGEVTRDDG